MVKSASLISLLVISSYVGLGSALASPQKEAAALVKQNYAEIKRLVGTAKDRDELAKQITASLDVLIDWDNFSSKTLSKKTWQTFEVSQKKAFITVYRKLIVRRYAKRFKPGTNFKVEFRANGGQDEGVTWVRTTVHSIEGRKKLGVDVDYEFWPGEKGHRVADIVTDGVSRARSYRPKFKRILNKRGFDALLKAIERNANKP